VILNETKIFANEKNHIAHGNGLGWSDKQQGFFFYTQTRPHNMKKLKPCQQGFAFFS